MGLCASPEPTPAPAPEPNPAPQPAPSNCKNENDQICQGWVQHCGHGYTVKVTVNGVPWNGKLDDFCKKSCNKCTLELADGGSEDKWVEDSARNDNSDKLLVAAI